jgi:hypothetical protein
MAKQKIGLGSRTEREKMKSYEDYGFVQANEQQMCVLRERECVRACVLNVCAEKVDLSCCIVVHGQ